MPDPQARAERFRERAEQCFAAAERTPDPTIRAHYARIAETYLEMAKAELASLKKPGALK